MSSSTILLNVGGVAHVTTRETLQRAPYFARLSHEAHGEIFIDRDGTHFRYILNHLGGECALPRDRTSWKRCASKPHTMDWSSSAPRFSRS